jgi:hypothetical protein
MHPRPKSSTEILATAKRAPRKEIRPRKSKTERSQPLKDRLSTLSINHWHQTHHTISDIPSADSSSSRTANVHGLNNVQFKDPTTPQKLEAALEIKEGRDVIVEEMLDLVGDELPTSPVPFISSNICNLFSHYLRHLPVN